MPKENDKVLKYNHGEKYMKVPFIIYADLESLLEKMSACGNNLKNSTTKINKHTPFGYSFFTQYSFDATKNKLDYYKGKDCMKGFCKDAAKKFDHEKKEMVLLALEESHKQKACHICQKGFSTDYGNRKYHRVRDHCQNTGKYRAAAYNICNFRYKTPKEITVVFHNGSSYKYHFLIKKLAEDFEGQFQC